jgi:hypothetical protein
VTPATQPPMQNQPKELEGSMHVSSQVSVSAGQDSGLEGMDP